MSETVINRDFNRLKCNYCKRKAQQLIALCDECSHKWMEWYSKQPITASDDSPIEWSDLNPFHSYLFGVKVDINQISVPELPFISTVNFVLFGTFFTDCLAVELNACSLRITSVSPNISDIHYRLNVNIPFVYIKRLMYCSDPLFPMIFIETTEQLSDLTQLSMNLGNVSRNRIAYYVSSDDLIERHIILDLSQSSYEQFVRLLYRFSKLAPNKVVFKEYYTHSVRRFIKRLKRKYESLQRYGLKNPSEKDILCSIHGLNALFDRIDEFIIL